MGALNHTLLHHKAQNYLKLAQMQLNLPFDPKDVLPIKGQKEQEYDDFIAKLTTINTDLLFTAITEFHQMPYFNFKVVVDELAKRLFTLTPEIIFIQRHIDRQPWPKELNNAIMVEMIKYYVDHFMDRITIGDYLQIIEAYDISEHYLRKVQGHLIKNIIEFANDTNHKYRQVSLDMMLKLLSAKKIDQTLLWRMAKHLGPQYYGELHYDYYGSSDYLGDKKLVPDFTHKKILDINDVGAWMEAHRYMLDGFQKMLMKADDKAKNYLRSFLYQDIVGSFFILDENMEPMNKDYKKIAWPDKFLAIRGWQGVDPIREIWAPIFEDFKIIPVDT
jgi:hypothetical protein